ncbi:hypothetical protein MPH_02729 [Macrophomina phaseolina MS6]|uniref:GDS1 winged helix domain-containing protein n=2 Tax=Macrophomina phaseolina TaxID=35725 RepID=K2SC85_MACPH|nr:hypothetical protein MPH_02729 [Macrophomina phaseolina MS6]KAH7045165.1 hypothetical protein B0J12DRAFT_151871 [Macrophomina phaseolina]
MVYNTRRKSLSLPMLGIQLPNSSRSHRSPPSNTPAAAASEQPPQKKIKRSHTSSASPAPLSPPATAAPKFRDERPKSSGRPVEHTPPPSPGAEGATKIDTEGINDDIVVAVIKQLEETGNRPHLLKELAAVLAPQLPIVESSANPSAIISSRLTAYIRRPWTALSPCPVGRELVGTHPKRIYFFLNTTPHQPIPEPNETSASANIASRIISPSLSSAADDSEEEEERDRRARCAMSPSPEVDLSSPELDNESDTTTFSGRSSLMREMPPNNNMAHNRRAASPPLEKDEREFTATASSLQQRSRSQQSDKPSSSDAPSSSSNITEESTRLANEPESEENAALRNSEAAALLFGHSVESNASSSVASMDFGVTSPVFKPVDRELDSKSDAMEDVRVVNDDSWVWSDWKNPESIELDELDDLLGDY